MPIDIDAEVVANTRLSEDYNVVALTAPGIASLAQPGQFVMIKPARGIDPLLRRPFSIFEILRDGQGAATGVSLLNKRIGVGTGMLYEARPGSRHAVLGTLGRPIGPIEPPAEAWMVAGGVGLGPFVTLAEALRARGTRTRLFYGARRASELVYVDRFERLGVESVIATEDGGRGAHGFITVPLAAELEAAPASPALRIYVCGPTPMMRAVAEIAQLRNRPCDVSLEQVMGCGLGGCYSCVVLTKTPAGPNHFVRSCVDGPVFDATRIVWDALTH
jgi:dihydroorotate dehydrogenase electron transfer subunit